LKETSFHSEWDEPALLEILAKHKELVKEKKTAMSTKPLPQALIIVDDFANRWDIMRHVQNVLTTLFIRGRHFGCNCWISSQKLTAISTVARVNFRVLCVEIAKAERDNRFAGRAQCDLPDSNPPRHVRGSRSRRAAQLVVHRSRGYGKDPNVLHSFREQASRGGGIASKAPRRDTATRCARTR
jgi:hypothetical protein